ncbi:MAG: oligopeptide transporter, OPT family, partial [Lysobacteraceae bacterium]
GAGATGYTFSYSLALMGAGHLVGISVGISMLLGIAIAWAGAVPILTAMTPQGGAALGDFVTEVWRTKVRFIGAGAMAVAAIWSLARTIGPILAGLAEVARAQREKPALIDHTDRDLSLRTMIGLVVLCTLVLAALVWRFVDVPALGGSAVALTIISIPIVLLGGFLIAAICGYMAGLIGSSNSPVSGVGILAAVGCSLCFIAIVAPNATNSSALVATALFVTSILFAGAVCSNDNLQDLKTGQLVGASPRRQQIALLIGVTAASLVVPLVLNLLSQAYGFAGAPNLDTVTAQPLPAPQANLISALAQGVIGHSLEWNMIGIGAAIGIAIIVLDAAMRAKGWVAVPPLAAGFGIY